MRNVAISEA